MLVVNLFSLKLRWIVANQLLFDRVTLTGLANVTSKVTNSNVELFIENFLEQRWLHAMYFEFVFRFLLGKHRRWSEVRVLVNEVR